MIHGPKTRAEAEGWRYKLLPHPAEERWSYTQVTARYSRALCAWSVHRWAGEVQCSRAPGHGPEGLWCKQHAKMAEVTE